MSLSRLQIPYMTTEQRIIIIPNDKDVLYDTDTKSIWVGDGTTIGGNELGGTGRIDALESGLSEEIYDRAYQDSILQGNIDALESGLSEEIYNRAYQDSILQGNIDALESGFDSLLDQEINDRAYQDSILQGNIDTLESGLAQEVYDRAYQDTLKVNVTELPIIKNELSTSLLTGGILSFVDESGGQTKFSMTGGTILVINNAVPSAPTSSTVTFSALVDEEDPYALISDTTYVGVDVNGDMQYSTTPFTEIERRLIAEIGWIDHPEGNGIIFVWTEPPTNFQIQAQFNDFLQAFGQFNVSGNEYTPHFESGGCLHLQRSAGRTFDNNSNYVNEMRNPHIIDSVLSDPVEIYYYYRTSPTEWNNNEEAVDEIDPNNYDNNGTLTAVPSGKWTIQLISYYAVYDSTDIQYGQKYYDTKDDATANLKTPVAINPYNEADTFRAWLIIKQGAVDLADTDEAVFRSAGKFGLSDAGSGSIGGSGGEINTASNVGNAGQGIYLAKVGVDLEFKNINSLTPTLLTISNDAVNKNIDFSVSSDSSKENVSNKENTTLDSSTTKYPTNRLVKEYVDNANPIYMIRKISTLRGY